MNVFISSKVRSNGLLAGGFRAKTAVARRNKSKSNSIIRQKYKKQTLQQNENESNNYDPYAIAQSVLQQQDKIEGVKVKKGARALESEVLSTAPLQIPSAVVPTEHSSVGNFTQDQIKGLQTLVKQELPETEKQTVSPKSAGNQLDQKDFEQINKYKKTLKSPRSRVSKLQTKINTQTTELVDGRLSEKVQNKFILQKNSSKSLILGQILQTRNSLKSQKRKMDHILRSKDKLNDDLEEDQSETSPHKWTKKGYTSHRREKKTLKSPTKNLSPKFNSRRNSDYVAQSSKESKAANLKPNSDERSDDQNTKTLKLATVTAEQLNQDIETAAKQKHTVTVASNENLGGNQDVLRDTTESNRKILVDNSSGALPTNVGNENISKEDSIMIKRVMSDDLPFASTTKKGRGAKKVALNPRIQSAVSKASKASNSSVDPDLIKFYMAFQSQSPSSKSPIQPHGVSFQKDLSKWRKAAHGMRKALKKIAATNQEVSKEQEEQSTELNQYGLKNKRFSMPSADGSTVRGQYGYKNDSPSLNMAQNRGFMQFKQKSSEQQQYEQRFINLNQGGSPVLSSGITSNLDGALKIQTEAEPPSPDFVGDKALNDRASPVAVQLTPIEANQGTQSKVDLQTTSMNYQIQGAKKRPESSDRTKIEQKNQYHDNAEIHNTHATNEAKGEVYIVQENEPQSEIMIINSFDKVNILAADQSLSQSLGETEDTKKAFAVQYVNQEPHITWEQLQGMHLEQVDAIINLQVGVDHPIDEKFVKQLEMDQNKALQKSESQLQGESMFQQTIMNPKLVMIPESSLNQEMNDKYQKVQAIDNGSQPVPQQITQEGQPSMIKLQCQNMHNTGMKATGDQTFGKDQQSNPVSQAYINKLEQSQETLKEQSQKEIDERTFIERPGESRLLRLAWAGYTKGDWKSGKSLEKTHSQNSPPNKRYMQDCEASREKERNYRYPNPAQNPNRDHQSSSPNIDKRSPHRSPNIGPMSPLFFQDELSGKLSRPLLASKAQLSAVLQVNAQRRKLMEQEMMEQAFLSELRQSGLIGSIRETETQQTMETKNDDKTSVLGQKQILKNLAELGSILTDTTMTEEAMITFSQQMQLYMTNLALGNQDDVQLALELERVQRDHRAKPYSQFINFPSSVKHIIQLAANVNKFADRPHSPAFYTRIRSQSGPSTINRRKSATQRKEDKRNLLAAKMNIQEPVKVEVNLAREFIDVSSSHDKEQRIQSVLATANEKQSIFANATVDESGVYASLTVQVEHPVKLSNSLQSTNKMSQQQVSENTSPKMSRKAAKSSSPRKSLYSQKQLFTHSSNAGANMLVQKAIQSKQGSSQFVFTENKGVRDSFSAKLKGVRDSVGVINSEGIQGKTLIPKQMFNLIDQLQNKDEYNNQVSIMQNEQADMFIPAHTIDNLVQDPQMIKIANQIPYRISSRNVNNINISKKGQEASAKSMATLHSDHDGGKFLRTGIYKHQINKVSNASITNAQRQSVHQDFAYTTGPSQPNLQPTQLLMRHAPSFQTPLFVGEATGQQLNQDQSQIKQTNRDGSVLTQFIGDASQIPIEQKSVIVQESSDQKDEEMYKLTGYQGNESVRNDTTDKEIINQEIDSQFKQQASPFIKNITSNKPIVSKSQMHVGKSGESKSELKEYVTSNNSPSQDDQYLKRQEDVSATLKQGPSSVAISQNDQMKTHDISNIRDSPTSGQGATPINMLGRLESKETVLKRNISPRRSKDMNKDMQEVASPVHLRSPKLPASPTEIKVESVNSFDPILRKSMEHDPGTMFNSKRSSAPRTRTIHGYRVPYPDDKPKVLRDPESYVNKMDLQFFANGDGGGQRFQHKSIFLKSGQNSKDIMKMLSTQKKLTMKQEFKDKGHNDDGHGHGQTAPSSPVRPDVIDQMNRTSEVAISTISKNRPEKKIEHFCASANHQQTKIKSKAELEIESIRQKLLHANLSKNSAKQADGLMRLLTGATLPDLHPEMIAPTTHSTALQGNIGEVNLQINEFRQNGRHLSNHSIISQNLQNSIQPAQTFVRTHKGTVIEISNHSNRQSQNRSINVKSNLVSRHRQNMSQAPLRRDRQFSRPISSTTGTVGPRPGTCNLISAMQNMSQGLARLNIAEPQIVQAKSNIRRQAQNSKSQNPQLTNYQSQPHPNTLTITATNGLVSQDSLEDAAHGLRDIIKSIEPRRNITNKSANMPVRILKQNWALNHEMDALVDVSVNIGHNQSDYLKNFNQDKTSTFLKGTRMVPRRAGPRQLTAQATKSGRGTKQGHDNKSLLSGTGTRDDSAGAWQSNK